MTQNAIFSPFFATMFLTLLVWVYLYIRRISFISKTKIPSQDLAVSGALAQISPSSVSNPSDNFKNLFEIPVLFYAIALYLFATKQVDAVYVTAAWIFVGFRVLHSIVHCTFNFIMLRFYLYLFATLAVWFMAIRAALIHFGTNQ
ncbi:MULTISPECIES: MAPEG family protein [unclassified Nodularia (in: cyanobacteria)]|uniref:MAPEG family protein n=1 Tax=unclassified Nodularia (in: cyanobacteria) TaxID=2656917 RepID=UPI001882A452|nr:MULTISPECIES: MAPEG family protein [unclassified Nodularia (in: cyanobacteria)]MBE9198977.1 MAPEG family protein [Nodularia sp. LEGE 06071]MCC2695913.1 MAPEG family protein [Nodularia sp. LEGE 04288]